MATKSILTAARVREVLNYNPDTGEFSWRQRGVGRSATVGGFHKMGYTRLSLDYGQYLGHMVAWLWMTGEWPNRKIDHINTIRTDNRWCNLRLATDAQSARNKGRMHTNTTGFTGVYYGKGCKGWRAQFNNKHLGIFATKEAAFEAYRQAALSTYGEFAHHSLKQPESSRHMAPVPSSATQLMLQMAARFETAVKVLEHLDAAVAAATP